MTGKNLQGVANLLPEAPQKGTMMQLGPLRHEVRGLRNENLNLRPLKGEMARLRSSLADWFFSLSKKETV